MALMVFVELPADLFPKKDYVQYLMQLLVLMLSLLNTPREIKKTEYI
jgi:hypothetical protein